MNYFEFYEIPLSFNVDEQQVKRKFYELSKKYHPDFFVNEPEDKQQEILELSTLNNKAYQVLSNQQKRTEYVLSLNNLINEGEKYQLPQDFLMEMMEVNETLMELEFDSDKSAIETLSVKIEAISSGLNNELQQLTEEFDKQTVEEQKGVLEKIKDIWYRQKYLLRIRDSLNKFATR